MGTMMELRVGGEKMLLYSRRSNTLGLIGPALTSEKWAKWSSQN